MRKLFTVSDMYKFFSEKGDLIRQRDDLIRQRDDLIRQRDDLIHQRDDLIHQRDDLIRQRDGVSVGREDDAVPAVLLNTLPKSASVFVLEVLAAALNKSVVTISPGYFPRDTVDVRSLNRLIREKGIAQSHLDASEFNGRFLAKIEKVVVQFRDPRQSMLSWLHHLDRLNKSANKDFLETVSPLLPPDYFSFSFEKKFDYQMKFYLPQVVTWMNEWVSFYEKVANEKRLMIGTYEAFVADPKAYFGGIFEFLGIPNTRQIQLPVVRPTTEKNFRLGKPNEWESVFTDDHKKTASAIIPKDLRFRFNWK